MPLDMPIDRLELSVRSTNLCKNANLKTAHALTQITEDEFLKLPGSSRKSLNEVREVLEQMGLHFKQTPAAPTKEGNHE